MTGTPVSALFAEGGLLAGVPRGSGSRCCGHQEYGAAGPGPEWQGALALAGTFQAPEGVARSQGAGGKERAF